MGVVRFSIGQAAGLWIDQVYLQSTTSYRLQPSLTHSSPQAVGVSWPSISPQVDFRYCNYILPQEQSHIPLSIVSRHFYPTISEVNESRSNGSMTDLSSDPSDLTQEHLYVSGSRWGHRYLKALRVQLISPVSPDRIFPSKFLPSDDDPAMQSCFRYIEYVADGARSFQRVENRNEESV